MSLQTARLIVLGETSLLVAAIAVLVVQYFVLVAKGYKGIVPQHMLGIAFSYLAFSIIGSAVVWRKWKEAAAFSGYTPCVGVASMVGLVSVLMVLRHLREVRRSLADQDEQKRLLSSGHWRSSRQLIVRTPSSWSSSTVWSSEEEKSSSVSTPGASEAVNPAKPLRHGDQPTLV